MSPGETSALIAGSVSLITACATYYTTRWKTTKDLDGAFASRLNDLRLEAYPKAFELTEKLGKHGDLSREEACKLWREISNELRAWKSGIAALVMSEESLSRFYSINEALKATPAKGDHYNDQQVERIFSARTEFRLSLRRDIGLEN